MNHTLRKYGAYKTVINLCGDQWLVVPIQMALQMKPLEMECKGDYDAITMMLII